MNTDKFLLITILSVVIVFTWYLVNTPLSIKNDSKIHALAINIGCNDPGEELQYQGDNLTKREQIKKIVLADHSIQNIIDGSNCVFLSNRIIHTGNGEYDVLDIDLDNKNELSTIVSLQNNSIVSYEIHDIFRTHPSISVSPYDIIFQYLYAIGAGAGGIIVFLIVRRHRSKSSL